MDSSFVKTTGRMILPCLVLHRRFLVLTGLVFLPLALQAQTFTLRGQITDAITNNPLPLVNVLVKELRSGDVSDSSGNYEIAHLKPGQYTVLFTLIGRKTIRLRIQIAKDRVLHVALEEQSILFDPIEITPGAVELATDEASSSRLSSREILRSANLYSRDIYRSLQALPGIAYSEWSSKPHVKGGNPDETAVVLDNLEIYEPFHLDEIDGPFSIISSDLVKEMHLYTGGFSAKHSDKMSGILRIQTIDRITNDSLRGSVDLMGASVVLNQRINDDLAVFTSGRRSFLYIMEKLNGADYPSEVYDVWNKLDWRPDRNNRLQLQFLLMNDKIGYRQDSLYVRDEFFDSRKRNVYLWLNWHRFVSNAYYFLTTAGYQHIEKASTFSFDASFTDDNRDRREANVFTLKQDHYLRLDDRQTLEAGIEFNQFLTDYRYREFRLNATESSDILVAVDVMDLDKSIDGYTAAGYIQDKWRWSDRVQVILGVRLSGQSYSTHSQWSPRFAVSLDATERLNIKLAYGWYYQPDNLLRLKVYQNQYRPDPVPEKSIHYVASLAYRLPQRMSVTADLYYKDYPRLSDDYHYDFFNRIEGVGIVDKPFETRNGYSVGLDLSVEKRYMTNSHISVAYSFGRHRMTSYDGQSTARDLDRRHTIAISHILNLPYRMTLSAQWRYHTGDPFTPSSIRVLGDSSVADSRVYYLTEKKNSSRLPAFHTLDIRLEKKWIGREASFTVYGGVINLYGRDNVRQHTWRRTVEGDKITGFRLEKQSYFPRFFLAGVSVEFDLPDL